MALLQLVLSGCFEGTALESARQVIARLQPGRGAGRVRFVRGLLLRDGIRRRLSRRRSQEQQANERHTGKEG
jgi:hypothetical protein